MFRKKRRVLSAWMVAMINVSAICSIKNFPLLAEYGLSVVLYLILSALFFFIPVSLISAELASAWPEKGIYTWAKTAFGPRMGFLAIWLEWIENVIYYPTILSFIVATFAYMIRPDLATNKMYVMSASLITFWLVTFVNFFGMKVSGWFSSLAAVLGTLIPISLVILMSGLWLFSGRPSQIALSWDALFPNLSSLYHLVLLSGVLFGLAGMEMSAVHAKDVANPAKDYPKGIFLSAFLILLFSSLGSLAIGIVVPFENIQLASGGMEAFAYLFREFRLSWATPFVAAITTFGALGMMSTWIVGPSRGLLATAQDGDLPKIFHKTNRYNMPVSILITQALLVSGLSFVFFLMPSVNSSYWVFMALASILYMIMYIQMFIAALRLRYTHNHIERPYRIPFGNVGIWIVALMGILGSGFGLCIAFFPPSQIETGEIFVFESLLIGGALLFCAIPFWIYRHRKPSWKQTPSS